MPLFISESLFQLHINLSSVALCCYEQYRNIVQKHAGCWGRQAREVQWLMYPKDLCSVQVGTPQGFGVCLLPIMFPPDSWDASFQIGLGFPPANLFRRRCRLLKVSSALIYILTTNLQKKWLIIWVAWHRSFLVMKNVNNYLFVIQKRKCC